MAIAVLLHSCLRHIEFFMGMRLGMQLRVTLIAAVYRKCLALSIGHTSSTGMIVNLVSNDVQRFEDAAIFGNFAWVGPIETVLCFYLVYREIGWAAFAAVGALLFFIPLQGLFARQFGRLRKETVLFRDERIKSISDMLAGIMVVKLYAWEDPFTEKIRSYREKELKYIESASIYRAINEAIFFPSNSDPPAVFLELCGFFTYFLIGGVFTPSKIFATLTYIHGVRVTMTNFFPKALQFISEALVSMKRIQDFLSLPEIDHAADNAEVKAFFESLNDPAIMIAIQNASFSWGESRVGNASPDARPASPSTDREILKDISLTIRRGELVGVCGPVGAGKSSLINAILGEMQKTSGRLGVRSRKISYASQTPWINVGSIKDNIVFGGVYDPNRFAAVLHACALDRDLDRMPDRENTLIGERGVTLSGGQRARLALARALYYDADIYILDDPLSAVDTTVGRHLFDEALRGMLRDKAVMLVTHQLQNIRACDTVVLLEEGRIVHQGSYAEVMAQDTPFCTTMREFATRTESPNSDEDSHSDDKKDSEDSDSTAMVAAAAVLRKRREKQQLEDALVEDSSGQTRELVKEEVTKGSVAAGLYFKYFKSGSNAVTAVALLLMLIIGQAAVLVTDWWLAFWSGKSADEQRNPVYIWVFVALCVSTIVISVVRAIAFFIVCLRSSKKSFVGMLAAVFRSPMSFFQNNPHGRIMNRFSKDISMMDEMLPMTFFDFIQCFFIIIGTFILCGAAVPYVLILVPFISMAFWQLRKIFLATSRQVKRFEATTRSPVYSDFPATLEGLSTIRAFSAENRFKGRFFALQDDNTRMWFSFLSVNRWLGFRLDMLSSLFLIVLAFAATALRGPLGLRPGLVGLMLSYSLQLMGAMQWAVRQSAEVENLMVSVERVFEYTELPSEAASVTDTKPGDHWPEFGDVLVNDMTLAYPAPNPADTPKAVLKGINVHFMPGTKVGIVGRTGAGKSSFLQALFRLVEPTPAGSIVIDGIKTSDLGLKDLRSRISIIPQEPFCFKGTLRFNIDPFGRYSDEELWRVLEAVELRSTVSELPGKLEAPVGENGGNWSVGERQLICLARAILRDTRLIVMDEATSAVDMRTDQLVQKAIRSEGGLFANATVLTIAHRLNTVVDFDAILVLEAGQVVEFDSPHVLLSRPESHFSQLADATGPENAQLLRDIAAAKAASLSS
ncbi:P-loop containing nucleoside triphosphate hydrolase protein [Entophlyctis helioformis]|nr:P-loop containing nucleoside triphosphate hydrolase protein [Entophlyctis helioformis]